MTILTFTESFLIAFIPAALIALATYFSYLKSAQFGFIGKSYEKQLRNFVAPAFFIIEPYLYKKIAPDTFENLRLQLLDLANNDKLLVNDQILDQLDAPAQNYQESFDIICTCIDSDITYLQGKLGLPRRGFIYRANHKQLKLQHLFKWFIFSEFFRAFVLPFLFLMIVCYAASYWINNF